MEKNTEKSDAIADSTRVFLLEGLSCPSCGIKIQKEIERLYDVDATELDFSTGRLVVYGKSKHFGIGVEQLEKVVRQFEPNVKVKEHKNRPVRDLREHGEDEKGAVKRVCFTIGIALFAFGIIAFELRFSNVKFPGWFEMAVYAASYLLVGWHILKAAVSNAFRRQFFDENFLMSVATLGAFSIRQFPESVAVMLFFTVGEMFQNKAVDGSRRSIKRLMDIRPDYANLKTDEGIRIVSPEEVPINSIIVVKPGEKVPLDGVVIEGEATVDTSALTGESVPRRVQKGDDVLSGMINADGLLVVKVTKDFTQSTVSKILELVERAASKKAPAEQFITKFSRYYTPFVVFAAVAIAVIPPLVVPGAIFSNWIYKALVFLVISCPCALVISIPLSFFGGIGRAARQGILVKGGNYLEALNELKTVVFDKTGTLTKGTFKVVKAVTTNNFSTSDLLEVAAHAEAYSTHPLARAILDGYGREVDETAVENYQQIPGYGVSATVKGQSVFVGNRKLLAQVGIEIETVQEEGTIVFVAIDGKYAGYIVVSDEIKEGAGNTVKRLKESGIRVVMLTGDRREEAYRVATQLGIEEFWAELLPHEKVEKVETLLKSSNEGKLAFVGDGVNDAPSLARADVGIAMGALGSDAAIEAADVVLMTDETNKIISALNTAMLTRRIVWENILLALGVKGMFLLLGAFGVATMWEAVFADVGVALIAILNTVRILRI